MYNANDIPETGILYWYQVSNHPPKNMQVFFNICDLKPEFSLCILHHAHKFCDECANAFWQPLPQSNDKQCN